MAFSFRQVRYFIATVDAGKISRAAANLGVSQMVYRPWSLEGRRTEVRPVTDHVPTMDVGLAWRRGTNMSAAARAFFDYLSLTFSGSGHGFVAAAP